MRLHTDPRRSVFRTEIFAVDGVERGKVPRIVKVYGDADDILGVYPAMLSRDTRLSSACRA